MALFLGRLFRSGWQTWDTRSAFPSTAFSTLKEGGQLFSRRVPGLAWSQDILIPEPITVTDWPDLASVSSPGARG